ncbi:hypothetical protein SS1G_11133 [Sclerotinia sclerotiorum 1980 UF-70]|uniref:Oxidation resistance protein 1 n=1 Tax=Sclerotinia sclerotiorum (strain ATCC 18683 / 1980 / Ss-1) TaxID=665079 RepID=A7F0L5_SCLS1|nr:hypothetical protein SS1G_11133 [Sclerotinia sclerotiorum 1980 UF-70]EDN95257.1 hypothetical protein SS1G_11133 [Sclerotinia sclerotiorum 1980 UF-70]
MTAEPICQILVDISFETCRVQVTWKEIFVALVYLNMVSKIKLFGAYLTEAPHPAPHYFGTGECFLWRATLVSSSLLANLPPPPSADTTNSQRSTTIGVPHPSSLLSPTTTQAPPKSPAFSPKSGTSTPERIRFKAFPYSGGGDGHYGLWLDDTFEKGISSSCPTFGNEPLSEEGEKFDILGVEVWSIGN